MESRYCQRSVHDVWVQPEILDDISIVAEWRYHRQNILTLVFINSQEFEDIFVVQGMPEASFSVEAL
jgi:hypothetical protein